MLAGVAETGTVRITLRGKDKPLHLLVALGRKRGTTKAKGAGKPDLEVVLQEGTWWEIVEGRLSPPDAFRRGRMRIRGDVNLGSRLYKSLAADDGSTDICWG
jgi:putative sterol carrier protein